MRLYDTKRDSDSIEDEESIYPFRMTKAELQSLDPNFKEKKKKVRFSFNKFSASITNFKQLILEKISYLTSIPQYFYSISNRIILKIS